MAANREILMKFITGQTQKIRENISRQGYKDDSPYRNNPSNTIYGTPEGTSITMKGVSTPLVGIDEFGNQQYMEPGQEYYYPGSRVVERPIAQVGGENPFTVSGNPVIIPTQGSYPLEYRDRGDKDVDGVPFSAARMVSRVDAQGKPLTRNQIAENQLMWNMQKQAYSPQQQLFNNWKNNPENTEQGFYNMSDWEKYLKSITPKGKDVPLEGLEINKANQRCDTKGSCTTGDTMGGDSLKDTRRYGGSWFGNADVMSVSNKYDVGGETVAEQYTKLTGKPWSTAKAQGLTDGSAQQNLALIEKLKLQTQPVEAPPAIEVINTSDKSTHTKEMAQRVVQIAEERIKNNNYIDVPQEIKEVSFARGEMPFGCIGGVCTVLKEAGVMDKVDWSNTHFADNAKEYGFTANQGWGVKGIKNLEPGDVLMTSQRKNPQGNYYPTHSQIYLGKTESGQLRFFDNFWKTERTYFEDEIKERLDPARKKTEIHATIYKVNPYDDTNPMGLSQEQLQNIENKKEFVERESKTKASYKWSIAPNAKDYNDTTKRVMDKFIEFANDNDKINDLVKKTGKSKEEIYDSLLNVFGELGAENNWTTSKGKGLGSRMENVAESVLTAFGGGKRLSVGPGQIKFNSIPKELREQFEIRRPNDLYDLDKVLPLMAAMDLKDKQVLENWGEQNVLSKRLFGWTRPEFVQGDGTVTGGFKADQLYTETDNSKLNNGVGRYSPYLRNQYSSIASGTTWENGDDWIPFNEGTLDNFTEGRFTKSGEDEMRVKYERDPGSYPYKVEQNWRDNLYRLMIPNETGQMELPEVVISRPKKKKTS